MIDNFEKYLKYLDNNKIKEQFLNNVYLKKEYLVPDDTFSNYELNVIIIDEVNIKEDGVEIHGAEFTMWFNFDDKHKYELVATGSDVILLKTEEEFKCIHTASELKKENSSLYFDLGNCIYTSLEKMKKETYDYDSYIKMMNFINSIPDFKKMKTTKKFKI